MANENKDRMSTLEAENAQLRDRLANIENLLAHQIPVVTPLKIEQDREEQFNRKKAELSDSCQVRSQANARAMWPEEKTEREVSVADVPAILIPSRSDEEAKARYDALCGINGVDPQSGHKYKIGKPQPAPAA